MALQFAFEQIEREIKSFAVLANPYLEPQGRAALAAWLDSLRSLRRAEQGVNHLWSIPADRPITTLPNADQVHDSRDTNLFGRLSTTWEVRIPVGSKKITQGRSTHFHLVGVACTRVSLWTRNADGEEIEKARWSFEVGDADSPGCHFHTQVKGDAGDRLFEPDLSIPRLPGLFVTAIDALDFLLGELFHNEWARHLGTETHELQAWSKIQKMRFESVLDWQRQTVRKSNGAVWIALKRAKPAKDQLPE